MCNISYLSDSQDHIHDSERDHEIAIKRLCKRSRPLSGLPYLVSSDRYHLNILFTSILARLNLQGLSPPRSWKEREGGIRYEFVFVPLTWAERGCKWSKENMSHHFFFTWYKLSWRAVFAWEYNQSSPTLRWFLAIAPRIVYCAYKPRTQENERAHSKNTVLFFNKWTR